MFDGNIIGNCIGIVFCLLFQAAGIWMMNRLLWKEQFTAGFRCLVGSVAGTLALQWLPLLFAFFMGFSAGAHLLAVLFLLGLCIFVWRKTEAPARQKFVLPKSGMEWLHLLKENLHVVLMAVIFCFFVYCLFTHTILPADDGSIHTGQATYGDMNMHLGFITSIANQKSFPPEYSIYPGVRLAYPFLCDSVSSSLYIWGASLRTAYILPMLIALCQVMGGFYCLIKYWLRRTSTAVIAWVMFFFNGGLGFMYFTDMESIARNFTDFYYTPTSLVDLNIRIPQIVANMLLPQRATLFGWAVLFPLLALLLCAIRKKSRKCFVIAGIFAGALPMIHTHSFLALGLICTMWLLYDCKELCRKRDSEKKGKWNFALLAVLPIGLAFFSVLQKINEDEDIISQNGMLILGIGVGILSLYILYYLIRVLSGGARRTLLTTWGIFLGTILVLALPQLLGWTFRQVGEAGFVRGFFNWSNTGDQYIWFYLKNFGLTFALFIPGYIFAKRKNLQVAAPLLLIWFVAELVVFQPNEYDNNKLLFIGFAFMCGLAADFVVDIYEKKWTKFLKVPVAVVLVFFGTVSAVLTLGREWVSDYELYSSTGVEACRYIEKNTKPDAVILTASNHNNEVASLTGRNIVCGAGTFLYYHGVDYADRENELPLMYGAPVAYKELYKTYGIDYVYVSDTERRTYEVNEEELAEIGTCVYSLGDVRIYKVK